MQTRSTLSLLALAASLSCSLAWAHDGAHKAAHQGGIQAQAVKKAAKAPFDIIHTKVTTEGNTAIFHMAVSGKAGLSRPTKSGKLAGSQVFSYVWPTSLDTSAVGFEPKAGILAFAVTSHPDFDDTPLFDENGDGDRSNDGDLWHSHWVVLSPDETCGPGALEVVDIPEGSRPRLLRTWRGGVCACRTFGARHCSRGADPRRVGVRCRVGSGRA